MNREERQLFAFEQLAREVEKLVELVQESQQNQYDFMQEACRLLQEQHQDVNSLVARAGTQDQLQGMLDEVLKQMNAQFQGQMQMPAQMSAGDIDIQIDTVGGTGAPIDVKFPGQAMVEDVPQSGVITDVSPVPKKDGEAVPIPLVEQGMPISELIEQEAMLVSELVEQEAMPVVKPMGTPGRGARVRFLHASPDTPGVDIYIDGKKVAEDVDYEGITDYLPLTPGRHRVQVFPYAKQVGALIDTTFNAKPNQAYSIAVAGAFKDVRTIIIEDEPKKTKPGFARVKIVHLSPNTPAVDVTLLSGRVLIGHLTFKEKSQYLQVAPGRRDLELRLAGKKDVVLRLPKMRFDADVTYTLYIVGLQSGQPALATELIPEG